MSRNLYAVIEVKRGSTWYAYSAPVVERSPELFTTLLGEGLPSYIPIQKCPVVRCGLPDNMSVVAFDIYSHAERNYKPKNVGWIGSDDIAKAQSLMYELNPVVQRTGIDEFDFEQSVFHTFINDNAICAHDGWDDSRIVFWTDK